MKHLKLFEGELGDDLDDSILRLIRVAEQIGEDVFLRWNSATMRISANDTVDSVLQDYDNQCRQMSLLTQERNGEILHIDKLSKKITEIIKGLINN